MPRRSEPEATALKVGERLRVLRLERNMSLGNLADAAGLSKGHLSSIEHGLAAITTTTVERLAKGLGVPALCLMTFPGDDEYSQIAELVRKMPAADVVKLRREVTKAVKDAAKAAKPQPTRVKT